MIISQMKVYFILDTSLKNARLTLQNLNAQNKSIKDQLDNYTIKAPVAGTITAQDIKVGDVVTAGMPILTISNKAVMNLSFINGILLLLICKLDLVYLYGY